MFLFIHLKNLRVLDLQIQWKDASERRNRRKKMPFPPLKEVLTFEYEDASQAV